MSRRPLSGSNAASGLASYVAVIIGPDLIVEDGHVRTEPAARAKQDQSIRGYNSMLASDPVRARELGDLVQEHVSDLD